MTEKEVDIPLSVFTINVYCLIIITFQIFLSCLFLVFSLTKVKTRRFSSAARILTLSFSFQPVEVELPLLSSLFFCKHIMETTC